MGTAATASSGAMARMLPSVAPSAKRSSNAVRAVGPAMAMPPRGVSSGRGKPAGGAMKKGRAAAISRRTAALP